MNFKDEFRAIKDKYNSWDRYSSVSKHILVGSLAVASLFGAMAATTYENQANTRTHINDINHGSGNRLNEQTQTELESLQTDLNYNNDNIARELEIAALALGIAGITVAIGETKRSIG